MDPVTITAISAGAQLAGQGINAFNQNAMNRKTRQWNEKMYAQQRKDSLADWTMQNEYNSPQAQMKRYTDAGLNPNLIYSQGSTTNASPVRSTDAKSWNPQAPEVDLGKVANAGLSVYYDTQLKERQIDNLKAQNNVLVQDALLKVAEINKVTTGTERDKYSLEMDKLFKKDIMSTSLDAMKQNIRQSVASTQSTIDSNERAKALQQVTLQKAGEEILSMRLSRAKTQQEINSIKEQIKIFQQDQSIKDIDKQLRQLDLDWRKQGITTNDNFLLRILGRKLDTIERGLSDTSGLLGDIFH